MSLSIIHGLKFRPLQTTVHRLDPRVKLLISTLLLSTALIYGEPYAGALSVSASIIFLEAAILRIARVARRMLSTLKGAIPFIAIVFALQLLTSISKPPLLAVYEASALTVRFVAFLASFSLFFLTTSPDEVGLTLIYLRVPYSYAFAFTAAIRFAPLVAEEVQNIIDAQRSRGVEFERGGFITRVRRLLLVFMPLLVNVIRRSYEMAEAMEVKCFGASKRRTTYRQLKALPRDYAVIFASTSLFFSAVYARLSGLTIGVP